jgi:hypothetical protein
MLVAVGVRYFVWCRYFRGKGVRMKLLVFFFSAFLGLFTCLAKATPWGLPGNAVTNSSGGQLSICLPEKNLQGVSLDSLFVSESQSRNGASLTMWQIELKKRGAPLMLKQGSCIVYGSELSGYSVKVMAKPLQVGSVYYARVNVDVADSTRLSILFYDVIFCVKSRRDEGLSFLQYKYDKGGSLVSIPCGED